MADIEFEDATPLTPGVYSKGAQQVGSATAFREVNNISASSSPTVNDDSGDGYHPGSLWYRVDTSELWICRSAGSGAASWLKIGAAAYEKYIAGNYYQFPQTPSVNSVSLATAVADQIKMFPFMLSSRISISHLTSRIGTQNGNWAFAIYDANQSTGAPTTALASSSAAAVPASGATREVALSGSVQIEPGRIYWAAINFSGSTATTTATGPGGLARLLGSVLDGSIGGAGTSNVGYAYNSQTCGTWADLSAVSPSSVVLGTAMHMIGFKCSAVP
jgi:hypothetical protein